MITNNNDIHINNIHDMHNKLKTITKTKTKTRTIKLSKLDAKLNTKLNTKSNYTKANSTKNKYITSEVTDDESYNHFKSLVSNSKDLCKGKTHTGKRYKVNISLRKDNATLMKDNHYRTIYVHDNNEIIAYIGTKKYKSDGGFIFIHKLCSKAGTGEGTRLMKMILNDAKRNHEKLGITYVSLTTHNLDLIDYYNKFNPTRTIEVDSPGSKRKIPRRVAYMIWQVSSAMPNLHYN